MPDKFLYLSEIFNVIMIMGRGAWVVGDFCSTCFQDDVEFVTVVLSISILYRFFIIMLH